jgi:hypothetical protein
LFHACNPVRHSSLAHLLREFKEEHKVPDLEVALLWLTLGGAALGLWAIISVRAEDRGDRKNWGKALFVTTLVAMGAGALVAAIARAEGLASLGLTAGLLVVGMVWEMPAAKDRLSEAAIDSRE